MIEKYIYRTEDERVLIDVSRDIFVQAMQEKGIAVDVKGKVATFQCPFCHSPDGEYFFPTESNAFGRFLCHHCGEQSLVKVSRFLDLSIEQMAGKPLLVLNQMAPFVQDAIEIILSRSKRVFIRNGGIVVVFGSTDATLCTLKVATVSELVRLVHELARPIQYDARHKKTVTKNIPEKVVRGLMDRLEYKHLQPISRIVRHPLIDNAGRVIPSVAGYKKEYGFYFAFRPREYRVLKNSVTTKEAFAAYERLRKEVLGEFAFKSKEDEAAAVLLLITAVVVPVLKTTPLFLASSKDYGVGKTTLCQIAAIFASTTPPTVITSRKDTDEFTREILASLINSTDALILENLLGNMPLNPTLCSAITGAEVSGRLVGSSRTTRVSLSGVLVMATGTKASPQDDMIRRTLPIRLERTTRNYKCGDILGFVRTNRFLYVADALKIVRWGRTNSVTSKKPFILNFPEWDTFCRAAIRELVGIDPAARMLKNIDRLCALEHKKPADLVVLEDLLKRFGSDYFTTNQALQGESQLPSTVTAAFEELGLKSDGKVNPRRFGRWLVAKAGFRLGKDKAWRLEEKTGKASKKFKFVKISLSREGKSNETI